MNKLLCLIAAASSIGYAAQVYAAPRDYQTSLKNTSQQAVNDLAKTYNDIPVPAPFKGNYHAAAPSPVRAPAPKPQSSATQLRKPQEPIHTPPTPPTKEEESEGGWNFGF